MNLSNKQINLNINTDFPQDLMPKKILHSKRRTIAIVLTDSGELIARAPLNCADKRVFDFILLKRNWITSKRNELKHNSIPALKLNGEAETIPIIGHSKNILFYDGKTAKLVGENLFLPKTDSKGNLKKFLIKFAKKEIAPRVQTIANICGYNYKSISIRDSKTRWGSCGYKNSLNFTFRLIMCPEFVINYIIVHELSHIVEKNHSHKFWQRVQAVLPNYKTAEQWLKTNKSIMNLI